MKCCTHLSFFYECYSYRPLNCLILSSQLQLVKSTNYDHHHILFFTIFHSLSLLGTLFFFLPHSPNSSICVLHLGRETHVTSALKTLHTHGVSASIRFEVFICSSCIRDRFISRKYLNTGLHASFAFLRCNMANIAILLLTL